MNLKEIKIIEYKYGQEKQLAKILNQSKEPVLIKIKNFTDQFDLDFFIKHLSGTSTYDTYSNFQKIAHKTGTLIDILNEIKQNKPHRIFGQMVSPELTQTIEYHVPIWKKLPQRPRYFNNFLKVVYFFGGKGSQTEMHYDREHCSILHLCFCGQKKFLLFTTKQNDNLYKTPFVGDTLIDFGLPREQLEKEFPRLKQAEGYEVTLEKGDMVFMPKNCWHYTQYIDASAAASYIFYPKKFFQYYGYITGFFYMGLLEKVRGGLGLYSFPGFKQFSKAYALADGKKKFFYKIIENILYFSLLPFVSIYTRVTFKRKPRRVY